MRTIHPSTDAGNASPFVAPADASLDRWGELLLVAPGLAEADRLARRGGDHLAWLLVGGLLLALAKKHDGLREEANYSAAHAYLLERFERANRGAA